ncbi:MAG: WD40 repeat domain-containing serine/threonine protein kinase, partial [Gemmataceae bacterium]
EVDHLPVVPGYSIEKELPRGPAGIRRFRAKQDLVGRPVLLEVVLAREDGSQRAWSSLRSEAGLLGKLQHPGIVTLLEAGERSRQLFFNAVEWVDGPTLAELTEDDLLPVGQALRLVERLAWAVAHAHQHQVYHRHLEPARVLLQPAGDAKRASGGPLGCLLLDAEYFPRITGFGLARKPIEGDPTDADLYVDAGFLSPEQAWGRSRELGAPTDVYGLGAILYALLTGRPPFRGPSLGDLVDAIQTAPLIPPSKIRSVSADIDAVCLKALARPLKQRHSSAARLAEDLRRLSEGLPPSEASNSLPGRVGRWIRRKPAVALLLATNMATLGYLGLTVIRPRAASGPIAGRATQGELERARATIQRLEGQLADVQQGLKFQDYRVKVDRAAQDLGNNNALRARLLLESCPAEQRGVEWFHLMEKAKGSDPVALPINAQGISGLAFDPTRVGRAAVTLHREGKHYLQMWDVVQRRGSTPMEVPLNSIDGLAFAPGGGALAMIGGTPNGMLLLYTPQGRQGQLTRNAPQTIATEPLSALCWNPQYNNLVIATARGRMLPLAGPGAPPGRPFGNDHPSRRTLAQFDPSGQYLLSFSENDRGVTVWHDRQLHLMISGPGEVLAMAAGPGPVVAVARSDDSLRFHALTNGQETFRIDNVGGSILQLAFSPDGSRLAAACRGGVVKILARSGAGYQELLEASVPGVEWVAFNASGKTVAAIKGNQIAFLGAVRE